MGQYVKLVEEVLSEQQEILDICQTIRKDCKPFLKLIKNKQEFFYRGMKNKPNTGLGVRRTDRKPKDTHPVFNDFLNLFLKEQKVHLRSASVFL